MLKIIHPSYALVAFLAGIIIGDVFTLASRQVFITSPLWLVPAGLTLAFTFFRPRLPFLIISLLAGFICINYRASFDLVGQDYFASLSGETLTVSGVITEDPDTSETRTALRLSNLQIGETDVPGTLYVQMAVNKDLERSDVVTLTGKFSDGFGTFSGTKIGRAHV